MNADRTRILAKFTVPLLLILLLAPGGLSRVAAQESAVDPRFGAVDAQLDPNGAVESNVGWERITFDWSLMQPGPDTGVLNTGLEEQWFTDARSQGRDVIGMIVNTPGWATAGRPNIGVPAGLYLSPSDPANLWAQYVRVVVGTYAQRGVNHWIIWDNPNIPSGVYGHGWEGSVEDYYQLLKVAYVVAKQVNPNARILLAGYSQTYDAQWLRRVVEVIAQDPSAADNNYYFDVATLHLYYDTERYGRTISDAFYVMQQNDMFKDIWIVESGAYPPDIALREYPTVTPEQNASFVIQSAALGLASGVQRMGVDHFVDARSDEGDVLPGLLDPAGGAHPAYGAFRVVTTYFAGADAASDRQLDLTTYVRIRHADHITHVAWARTAQPVLLTIPSTADTATLIDQSGNAQTIRPSSDSGRYEIRLEGANCNGEGGTCPIGGPVLLLVEGGFDPFVVPTPSAPLEEAPAPTLAPGEATATPAPSPTPRPTASPAPVQQPQTPAQVQPTAPAEQAPTTEGAVAEQAAAVEPTLPPTPLPTPAPTPIPRPPTGAAAALPLVLVGLGMLIIGGGVGFWLRDRGAGRVAEEDVPEE